MIGSPVFALLLFVCLISGVAGIFGASSYYWLGASDAVTEGVWLWTDGTLATDMLSDKYEVGQPDGGSSDNGLAFRRSSLRLHDYIGSKTLSYVCEIDLI